MSDRAVHFSSIQVHRVLGISQGQGFDLTDLSPGVNLIHGPNGSGKSTTAQIIQELLWAGHTGLDHPTVSGRFHDGQTDWSVNIEAGYVQTECNGQSGIVPDLGPPENRLKYHLALHELIGADNANFAKAITDASQGGFDLEGAARALGFTEKPSLPRKQSSQLKDAQEAVNEARRHQQGIQQAASRLPDLREDRQKAVEAEQEMSLLQKAEDYLDAKETCEKIQEKRDALPTGLSDLRGDEREILNQLIERQKKLEGDLQAEHDRIREAENTLSQSNLPDPGVNKDVLVNLRTFQQRLKNVEIGLDQTRPQLTKAKVQADAARKRLGDTLTDDQLALIESVKIGELNAFAREADQVRAKQTILEERHHWLDCKDSKEIEGLKADQIHDGITALSQWLASPAPAAESQGSLAWPIWVAAIMIAVLGCILAYLHHWAWMVTLLPAAGLMIWDFKHQGSPADASQANARTVHQHSYNNTGLQPPQAWETQAVSNRVRDLVRLAGILAHEDDRKHRLDILKPEAQAINQQQDKLDQQRDLLEQRLGLHLDMANEWLPLLVDNISQWQRSHDDAQGCMAMLQGLQKEQVSLLVQINRQLAPFGYANIESADQAGQWIEDLAYRQNQDSSAIKTRHDSIQRIEDTIEPDLKAVTERRQDLYARLGLTESEDRTLDDWLAQLPEYHTLKHELAKARTIRDDRTQSLTGREDLLALDQTEISTKIDTLKTSSYKRDALSEEIATIERDIEAAKAGHEVSDALEVYEQAMAALTDSRDQNAAAATGALLTKWVRSVAIERSRPQVFKRANELFVQFTRGTLKLDLDDQASPPRFLACQGSSQPRAVDQLSVGERVQLLIAVRIAFLEQDERTRLPMLLDETLGTSDDMRVSVIIDAIIEIARQGRQVFYFTAQHDEVGKWISRLTASKTPHQVIDLAQVRHLSQGAAAPLRIAQVDVPHPPAPIGMNHLDYGQTLGVPNINPTVESLDNLHLWHLIEDVTLLHRLLCLQITSWSQLQTLLEHRGADLVHMSEGQIQQIYATVRAIEAACTAWRIGRGTRVDCQDLLDSNCVTDSFIGELSNLAQQVDGDAQAMIWALEQGQVSRWRQKNTEGLREFFEEHGFLAHDTPLTPEAIRIRVLATMEKDLRDGKIEVSFIDHIISSLP